MKNEIKVGKDIPFVFCLNIDIETFTFLDHKEILHTHDGMIFCKVIWRQISREV